jgi:hypothetical protein
MKIKTSENKKINQTESRGKNKIYSNNLLYEKVKIK